MRASRRRAAARSPVVSAPGVRFHRLVNQRKKPRRDCPSPGYRTGSLARLLRLGVGRAGRGPFRLLQTCADTQPAFGLYGRATDGEGYTPQAIQVLTLGGDRIARLHGFVRPDLFRLFGLPARL